MLALQGTLFHKVQQQKT